MFELVLGTHNTKKRDELRTLLPDDRIELLSLDVFPDAIEVVEDGETFEQNAAKKATEQAKHLGRWVMAEDSGLSVDALSGAPGVHSARFAGRHGDDEANNDKLLDALQGVPDERRGAHYTCRLCLADPHGNVREQAEGICRGRIAHERAGSAGFGYDPLFVIPEYHRTFGELGPAVKQALSHRSRALGALIPQLLRLVERETAG